MRIVLFLTLFISASTMAQQVKSDRIFAWQIDVAENNNYDSAWAQAENVCMESTHFFLTWSSLVPDTGDFDPAVISGFLNVLDVYLSARNMPMEFVVAPINTVKREVPSELESVPFNDPLMIRHFKQALDTIFYHLRNVDMVAFNIGNESDGYLGTNATAYSEYKTFLDSVVPYAKALYQQHRGKDLKVGTTLTHSGLTDPMRSPLCQSLNAGLDIVSVTYYPLNADFTMKSPSVVEGNFDTLVNVYSDTTQPIYFVECGYSSSPVCRSTEELQAAFYMEVFKAWDKHKSNIKYISVFKLTDWSLEECQDLSKYYGISDTIFIEYLHGLGVRRWNNDGLDKDAMWAIKCALAERDWCDINCNTKGISELEFMDFTLYPNPSNGNLYLDVEESSDKIFVEIYSSTGQLVNEAKQMFPGINAMEIHGNSGLYFVKVLHGERVQVMKVLLSGH